jgi:hypothetical protein
MHGNTCDVNWIRHIQFYDRHAVCTDGAPAMTCRIKGLLQESTHCPSHREALVVKTIPAALRSVMDSVVALVNCIKTRAVETRLLKVM